MLTISKHLEENAKEAINNLAQTGKIESTIKDSPGYVVIKNDHLPPEGLMPLKNIKVNDCKFTICMDRRK